MQPAETLPHELEEEILSYLPIKIRARFSSVCKRWNNLFKERRFFNNYLGLARPQFILFSGPKICSVDVNLDGPSIEVYNLPSDIPSYVFSTMIMHVEYCDGLLSYVTNKGFGIYNPWLGQIRWIRSNVSNWKAPRDFSGMGYENSRADKHYKIFRSDYHYSVDKTSLEGIVAEFGSNEWKSFEINAFEDWDISMPFYSVSLNGTLYWVAINHESHEYFIQSFDFSTERFKPYCILPTKNANPSDARSLSVFREDQFSFLEQDCYKRNIEIWVTKENIKNGDGEAVEWVNLMSVSVPEWSSLRFSSSSYPPSYFVNEDYKSLMSLVICCYNKEGKAYIYIAKGDKFHEIEIKDFVEPSGRYCARHRTYFSSLVQVPTFKMSGRGIITQQEVESRFARPRGVQVSVGGDEWDNGFFENVKTILVNFNNYGIIFVKSYCCKDYVVVAGAAHGDSRITYGFTVNDDDYIEAIEGTYTESHITSITFRSHKGRNTQLLGVLEGMPFVLGGGRGSKIIGFYGRSSDVHLTALGVHLSPSP
ncbi:PREDICTED: jacalin-related lectin 38-like [Camelina sativa]|uniref:Jacalin-related lectin 38-like n=1 Tax=Camelina sativa TaxID=90675 RepID=A0ABM0SQH8_CAMSA|nr:PREDICTED: jacalin-related lectin 38-like [Camelina sativa]